MTLVIFAAPSAYSRILESGRQTNMLFPEECIPDARRRTLILLDIDGMTRADDRIIDDLLGGGSSSGLLTQNQMQEGEQFHIVFYNGSRESLLASSVINGCFIGTSSRSAADFFDPKAKAEEFQARLRQRIRNTLQSGLRILPVENRQYRDSNTLNIIRDVLRDLDIREHIETRIYVYGTHYFTVNGQSLDMLTDQQQQGLIGKVPAFQTTLNFWGNHPLPSALQTSGAGVQDVYRQFWSRFMRSGGGSTDRTGITTGSRPRCERWQIDNFAD